MLEGQQISSSNKCNPQSYKWFFQHSNYVRGFKLSNWKETVLWHQSTCWEQASGAIPKRFKQQETLARLVPQECEKSCSWVVSVYTTLLNRNYKILVSIKNTFTNSCSEKKMGEGTGNQGFQGLFWSFFMLIIKISETKYLNEPHYPHRAALVLHV